MSDPEIRVKYWVMSLTLLQARTSLDDRFRTGATIDQKNFLLNRAGERLILSGEFKGGTEKVAITAYNGVLSLPRRYSSILKAKVSGVVRNTASQWYEFLSNFSDDTGYVTGTIRSQGTGYPTFRDIPSTGTFDVVTTENDDDGKEIYIEGLDASGSVVSETLWLNALSNPNTVNSYTSVTRVIKPAGTVYVTFEQDGTTFARYEPGETIPDYHRYFVQGHGTEDSISVDCLCRVRHVDAVSDNDILSISNLSALSLALDSLYAEQEKDMERSQMLFGMALSLLNQEALSYTSPDDIGVPRVNILDYNNASNESFI